MVEMVEIVDNCFTRWDIRKIPLPVIWKRKRVKRQIAQCFYGILQKLTAFNKNPHVFATDIVDKHVDIVDKVLNNDKYYSQLPSRCSPIL